MSLSLAAVGFLGSGIFALFFAVAYGIGMHWFNTLYPALVQASVPRRIVSRASSFEFLAFDGLMPLGVLLIGDLSAKFGSEETLTAAGLIVAGVVVSVSFSPGLRNLEIRELNESE